MCIAVIGGSIGGLTFAKRLKELDCQDDFAITLYEEHAEIGRPVQCAEGWLAVHGLEPPPPEVIEMPLGRALLRFRDSDVEGPFELMAQMEIVTTEKAWVISRARHEQLLAEQCQELGVQIRTGEKQTIQRLLPQADLISPAQGWPPPSFQRIL